MTGLQLALQQRRADRSGRLILPSGVLEGRPLALFWLGVGLCQAIALSLLILEPLWAFAIVGGAVIGVVALRHPFLTVLTVMVARLTSTNALSVQLGPLFVSAIEPAFMLAFLIMFVRSGMQRRSRLRNFPNAAMLAAFLVWAALSVTWSPDKVSGTAQVIRLGIGVALVWLLASELRTMRKVFIAAMVWIATSCALGLVGQYLGQSDSVVYAFSDISFRAMSGGSRLGGLGQHPNWFAMNLAYAINPAFVFAYTARLRWQRLVLLGAAFIILFAVISSASRGATWGTALGSLFLALHSTRLRKFLYRYWVLIALGFLVVLVFGLGSYTESFVRVATRGPSTIFVQGDIRLANWSAVLQIALASFGLGTGAGGYGMVLPLFDERLAMDVYAYPHGVYWDVLVHFGVVGVVLLAVFGWRLTKHYRRVLVRVRGTVVELWLIGAAASLVGYGAHCWVEFHLVDKPIWLFLGLFHGLLLAADRMSRDPEKMRAFQVKQGDRPVTPPLKEM